MPARGPKYTVLWIGDLPNNFHRDISQERDFGRDIRFVHAPHPDYGYDVVKRGDVNLVICHLGLGNVKRQNVPAGSVLRKIGRMSPRTRVCILNPGYSLGEGTSVSFPDGVEVVKLDPGNAPNLDRIIYKVNSQTL